MRGFRLQILAPDGTLMYQTPLDPGTAGQTLVLGADNQTLEWTTPPDVLPFSGTITGDGTTATFSVTHNQDSAYPAVAFYAADGRNINANFSVVDNNTINVTPEAVLAAGTALNLSVRK